MATAFDTFPKDGLGHYAGQLEDRENVDIVSRAIADTAGVGFGLGVTDIDGYSAEIPTAGDVPNGITLREFVQDNPIGYEQCHTASVIREGRVWVEVADGVDLSAGSAVYVVPDTGAIVSTSGGNLALTNARFLTNATAGALALVQLNGN